MAHFMQPFFACRIEVPSIWQTLHYIVCLVVNYLNWSFIEKVNNSWKDNKLELQILILAFIWKISPLNNFLSDIFLYSYRINIPFRRSIEHSTKFGSNCSSGFREDDLMVKVYGQQKRWLTESDYNTSPTWPFGLGELNI